jgi:predicted PurR-regulated permease PerM
MIKLPFYARLALTLLSVVLVFHILKVGGEIFIPLAFALLISIFLYPLTKLLEEKLKLGRFLSAFLAVIFFFSAFVTFAYFLILQSINFMHDFPTLRKRFLEIFIDFQHWLSDKLGIDSVQQNTYINSSMKGVLENIATSAGNLIISITTIIVFIVFIFLFTFFMLYHRRLLMKFMLHTVSLRHREKVQDVILATKHMINSYVLGLVIETILLGIILCTMLFCLGVDYALLLGVMAAVFNIIPYIGIYGSMSIIMLVTLGNNTATLALQTGVGIFVVHVLEANILMPRIVGSRVKMNPFITIVAVIIGQAIWGIPGMFLFIPITGIAKLVCERVEGLEAWGFLIGTEDNGKQKNKISID